MAQDAASDAGQGTDRQQGRQKDGWHGNGMARSSIHTPMMMQSVFLKDWPPRVGALDKGVRSNRQHKAVKEGRLLARPCIDADFKDGMDQASCCVVLL